MFPVSVSLDKLDSIALFPCHFENFNINFLESSNSTNLASAKKALHSIVQVHSRKLTTSTFTPNFCCSYKNPAPPHRSPPTSWYMVPISIVLLVSTPSPRHSTSLIMIKLLLMAVVLLKSKSQKKKEEDTEPKWSKSQKRRHRGVGGGGEETQPSRTLRFLRGYVGC